MANLSDEEILRENNFPLLEDIDNEESISPIEKENLEEVEPIWFHADFTDRMELYADMDTVEKYFSIHREWFCRCAQPMTARPIGENAYDLLIGRFGAFGYRVEARVGLDLVPPDAEGIYRIITIPLPDYTAPGYEVDYRSTMQLVKIPLSELKLEIPQEANLPEIVTAAQWHLDLSVGVKFPKFIRAMSAHLIQTTGDRLLEQIVRQVSRRLTHKTQVDFHTSHHIPFPLKKLKK